MIVMATTSLDNKIREVVHLNLGVAFEAERIERESDGGGDEDH
jgi:hypothetical protein